MEWKELVERFRQLTVFFGEEFFHIPHGLRIRIGDEWSPIALPLKLETLRGKKIAVKLVFSVSGGIVLRLDAQNGFVTLVRGGSQVISSPDSFLQVATMNVKWRAGDQLDTNLVLLALARSYYDLEKKVRDYFERARKKASDDEHFHWSQNRELAHARRILEEIRTICEKSRATVGKSSTLGRVRECAEKGFYAPAFRHPGGQSMYIGP